MHIRLFVLSLLIMCCCSDALYGAGVNWRTRKSLQNRRARQIRKAKKLKKLAAQCSQEGVKQGAHEKRIEAAMIEYARYQFVAPVLYAALKRRIRMSYDYI